MPRSPSRTPSCPVGGMTVSSKHIQRSRCLPQTAVEACPGVKGGSRRKTHLQASKEVLVMSRAFIRMACIIRMACSRVKGDHTSHKASSTSEALKDPTERPATPQKDSSAMDPSMMFRGPQVIKPQCVTCMLHSRGLDNDAALQGSRKCASSRLQDCFMLLLASQGQGQDLLCCAAKSTDTLTYTS